MNALTINHVTLVAHQRRLQEALQYLPTNGRGRTLLLRAIEEVDEWLADPARQVKK